VKRKSDSSNMMEYVSFGIQIINKYKSFDITWFIQNISNYSGVTNRILAKSAAHVTGLKKKRYILFLIEHSSRLSLLIQIQYSSFIHCMYWFLFSRLFFPTFLVFIIMAKALGVWRFSILLKQTFVYKRNIS
jgi:hypothetical protein